MLGLAVVLIAIQSPLDTFGAFSLQVHMVQHLLLMLVAAPLILLSAPRSPLLTAMPGWFHEWLAPFARWRLPRAVLQRLLHPISTWLLFVAALWLWHSPQLYDLALRNAGWHRVEHASFLITAILFWWPVVRPYPSRLAPLRWWLIPYLFLAGVQGTALAGVITFSDRVLYSHYAITPNVWGLSALADQNLAGAIMWVPTSIALLIPMLWIVGQQMSAPAAPAQRQPLQRVSGGEVSFRPTPLGGGQPLLPILPAPREPGSAGGARLSPQRAGLRDRETLFGRIFRRRWVRRALKFSLLALALIVVVDGFTGPQVSMINLAGVAPWIHWRGLLVLALLVGGNFFCMACPFPAFRSVARRLFSPRRRWPRLLRNKWLAVGLLIVFFWAYESWSLWDRPSWTAAIIVGYFAAAFAFDALFVDAPFCKFICPIGQFNFVQSLVSPSEVAVVSPHVCESCQTKDCIAGNQRVAGCQLSLFLPSKAGNMDCTGCLDCADACPHGNVALQSARVGLDLVSDRRRSGVGRYAQRRDLAALIVVLLFASLVNAAWMTAPVAAIEERLTQGLGVDRLWIVTAGMLLGLCVAPLLITAAVAKASACAAQTQTGAIANLMRFAPALVPLGLGMWLAHYSFHLFTSGDTLLVAAARFAHDWLGHGFALATAACNCCEADAIGWLLPLELLFLDFGLCVSLYAGYRIAQAECPSPRLATRAFAPWLLLMLVFFASCVWVLLQPMQMRGAFTGV